MPVCYSDKPFKQPITNSNEELDVKLSNFSFKENERKSFESSDEEVKFVDRKSSNSSSEHSALLSTEVGHLYETRFDPKIYFDQYCKPCEDPELLFWFRNLVRVFSPDGIVPLTIPHGHGTLIDVGCGPVPSFSAAASRWASSIVMADFLPQNLFEIFKWKTNAPGKLDWGHHLDIVGRLEQTSKKNIEARLKSKMEKIIPCDLYRQNPIYPHQRQFSVALSSLCLEFAATDEEDYFILVKHLANLIKPGGLLVMQGALGNTYYMLAGTRFPSVPLTKALICQALEQAGLTLELWNHFSRKCHVADKPADHDSVFFLVAKKD